MVTTRRTFLKLMLLAACGGLAAFGNSGTGPKPPGLSWPGSIVADVGDLQVRFESRSFWTMYRVEYHGKRIGVDRFGSHYGSVAAFRGVGFIGSGHTENEDEQVLSVNLYVDGVEQPQPSEAIAGEFVRLRKRSRIRSLLLETDILVKDDCIVEDVTLSASEPTPVDRIYHFMHPWTPKAREYAAELTDGTMVSGVFNDARDFKVDAPTRWSAVYDETTGAGGVIAVLDTPEGRPWKTWYWDVPNTYRKHYLVTFQNEVVPAGVRFHYRAAVIPFTAEKKGWIDEARRAAARRPSDAG